MNRSLRRFATWLSLAGFLFAQAILVAYACPLRAPTGDKSSGAVALATGAQPVVADERCPGHADDPAPAGDPACGSHCSSQQAVPTASAPEVPPLVLAPFPVVVPMPGLTLVADVEHREPTLARAAAPPQLRYSKLLI